MMWESGGWVGGLVWMVLFWGLLVAGIVWLVRAAMDDLGRGDGRGAGRDDDGGSARVLLDERFASGELSVAEYRERRDAVESGR